jgi:glyoxylase-like metal-dependent hydrolase (beta-lactamase superfamily II)
MPNSPAVTGFYHEESGSIAYVAADPATRNAVIIDPVLDFDANAGRISTDSADAIIRYVQEQKLSVDWILDTHPHADHFSAAIYLKEKLGAPTAIGKNIGAVQELWKKIYNLPDFPADGSQWDRLLGDADTIAVGSLQGRTMFCPGHTLASLSYIFGDAAFIHDTLLQPDTGSARCDFPGGSAATLYDSISAILALPDQTRLFTGHDYKHGGRPARWESTVAEQKRSNIHFKNRPSREAYVALREARDKTLPMPRLILQALQFNMRGGRLPPPESNGVSYLKIPIGAL